MELNKNSKWLSIYLYFNNNRPSNFCDYFWGSIKSLIFILFLTTFGLFLASCLLSPIMLFWESFDEKSDISEFQVLGIIFWGVGIFAYVLYHILYYYENRGYQQYKESVIKIWYKDFKNKHCTLITWVDEK